MSSFYAYDFIFDDIPSHKWDLKIISFEDGGLFNGVGSSDVNIIEQRVLRKSKPYYLGRTQETKLEFPLTFGTSNIISGLDRDLISAWLFGRSGYKKLYVLQDDLNGMYFNCFLTKPEPLYIGGVNYAFTCQVVCDSPWAYGPEYTVSGSAAYDTTPALHIEIYNSSSEDEYLYPIVNFTAGVSGIGQNPTFRIWNVTDSNRQFTFTNLVQGSQISVNNDLQIVTATPAYTSRTILSCFNKNWFRLLRGYNDLVIDTTATSAPYFEIKYTERFKIGG